MGTSDPTTSQRRRWQRLTILLAALIAVYVTTTYVLVPALWVRYARRHPTLEEIPQLAEASAKMATPRQNIRLRPKWSPSEPPANNSAARSKAYDSTIH